MSAGPEPFLAVDIGNSHTVIGLFSGAQLRCTWRIASRRDATHDELEVLLRQLLGQIAQAPRGAVVASVVPSLTAPVSRALSSVTGARVLEVAPGIKTGLKIRTDSPAEVGADRIVNALAAIEIYGPPAIVVDLGTATTLDIVSVDGEYLGGVICPGPQLSAEALSARTARLPRIDLCRPARVVGRNTVDAMRSGIVVGHAAMVEGLVSRIEQELGTKAKLILTGGLAELIAPLLPVVDAVAPDLTLQGLRLVWERNPSR
jgi:type III pantothenate kinase